MMAQHSRHMSAQVEMQTVTLPSTAGIQGAVNYPVREWQWHISRIELQLSFIANCVGPVGVLAGYRGERQFTWMLQSIYSFCLMWLAERSCSDLFKAYLVQFYLSEEWMRMVYFFFFFFFLMSFFHKVAIWCQIITTNPIFLILLFRWIGSNFSFLGEKQKFDQ